MTSQYQHYQVINTVLFGFLLLKTSISRSLLHCLLCAVHPILDKSSQQPCPDKYHPITSIKSVHKNIVRDINMTKTIMTGKRRKKKLPQKLKYYYY